MTPPPPDDPERDAPQPHRGGRPPHQPTAERRRQARAMALRGIPHRHIAAVLGVSEPTLRKHYGAELAEGMAEGASWAADRIRDLAERGHWGALKQMAAVYLDWSDRVDLRHAGADGGTLELRHYLAIPEDQRRAALEALAGRVLGPGAESPAPEDGFEPE